MLGLGAGLGSVHTALCTSLSDPEGERCPVQWDTQEACGSGGCPGSTKSIRTLMPGVEGWLENSCAGL